MKDTNLSIDDLHQASLAEFEEHPEAQAFLNALYASIRETYIAQLKLLRLKRTNLTDIQ